MRKLVILPSAEADLREIGDFIAQDNLDAAISFVERLRRRCDDLLPFPGAGSRRDEIRQGYRSVAEGDYIILYRLRADDAVVILRIVHSKRDIRKIKFEEPENS